MFEHSACGLCSNSFLGTRQMLMHKKICVILVFTTPHPQLNNFWAVYRSWLQARFVIWVNPGFVKLSRPKTNKMTCVPSKDSDQPGHPPSLIGVFAVRMKKAWVLSYPLSAQGILWSDWADAQPSAQADLSLGWAHSQFVGFVMRRLTGVNVSNFILIALTILM